MEINSDMICSYHKVVEIIIIYTFSFCFLLFLKTDLTNPLGNTIKMALLGRKKTDQKI